MQTPQSFPEFRELPRTKQDENNQQYEEEMNGL
jgi:hypothetical protein